MARVTVEDCIDKVDNRFDLVLLAAHRARMISSGSQLTIDRDNDKNPVVALREIADSTISPEDLRSAAAMAATTRASSRRSIKCLGFIVSGASPTAAGAAAAKTSAATAKSAKSAATAAG